MTDHLGECIQGSEVNGFRLGQKMYNHIVLNFTLWAGSIGWFCHTTLLPIVHS